MYCDDLEEVYYRMYLIRKTEQAILAGFAADKMGGTAHLCIGQEASAVGVCSCLDDNDAVFSNHRGHGHMLAKGLEPEKFLAELAGRSDGQCGGLGGSQHIAAPSIGFMGSNGITGGSVPIAVGYALGQKLSGSSALTVAFFGDGATSQGAVAESLNLSCVYNCPIIFVCENNLYAMSSPTKNFVSGLIKERAEAYGMRSFAIDGMNVREVIESMNYAKEEVKKHPVFMEIFTYRFAGHSKSDRELYRSKEEVKAFKTLDPIFGLHGQNLLSSIQAEQIRAEVDFRIEDIKGRLGF